MLHGIDISHHNTIKDPNKLFNAQDFIFMKATEGITFVDKKKDLYCETIDQLAPQVIKGFYHFARPEKGNAPEVEAQHFLNNIRKYKNNTLLALDVEAEALTFKNLDQWVERWCSYIIVNTGRAPLIYCSAAECKRFKGAAALGCGLWVAKWSDKKPTKTMIKPWDFFAFWQYDANGGLDKNYFNGSVEALKKYAGVI